MQSRQYRISSGAKKQTTLAPMPSNKSTSKTSTSTGLGSRIDELNADLFSQLETVMPNERLGDLTEELGLSRPLNKYERLAAIGKNHVATKAPSDFEEKKKVYEMQKKKEKKEKRKKKVTRDLDPKDPAFFVTGVGVEQAEEESGSDEESHKEELKDKVDEPHDLDDDMNALLESVMQEIKEECFGMKKVGSA